MRPEASIAAVQFKAECLSLLDRVARTRRPLVMTKRGKPVAQLVPMPLAPALFGALAGSVLGEGDLVSGIGEAWDADRWPRATRAADLTAPAGAGVLLDTHVLVWLLQGSELLGSRARAAIESATAGRSGVVVAEISI